jgi:hypothetical protein
LFARPRRRSLAPRLPRDAPSDVLHGFLELYRQRQLQRFVGEHWKMFGALLTD